jgi:hypothetical protein
MERFPGECHAELVSASSYERSRNIPIAIRTG